MTESRQRVLNYEQTVQNIIALIHKNELKSGDKLPTERELAKQLAVSRSSLREALQILATNGYIKIKRSSGIYLTSDELPQKIPALSSTEEKLSLQNIQELLEARILLESYTIKQAAKIITAEQLQNIYDLEDEAHEHMIKESKSGGKPFGRPSIQLEHMLVQIQPNHYLTDFHRRLCTIWRDYCESNNFVTLPPVKRHRDHLAILKAVSENKPAMIERYVSAHLRDTYDSLTIMLEEIELGDSQTDEHEDESSWFHQI
ncbi:MAG: FadR/GntR family transcriptional regulator [Oscillospiraceae bacterium]